MNDDVPYRAAAKRVRRVVCVDGVGAERIGLLLFAVPGRAETCRDTPDAPDARRTRHPTCVGSAGGPGQSIDDNGIYVRRSTIGFTKLEQTEEARSV